MATPPTSAPPSGAQTSSRTAAHSLARYREEFPIFRDKIYLNTCSLGALGERTRRKLAEFVDLWQSRGASAWYDVWWAALGDLRRRYGSLIGAAPEEIALAPSISGAVSVGGAPPDARGAGESGCGGAGARGGGWPPPPLFSRGAGEPRTGGAGGGGPLP